MKSWYATVLVTTVMITLDLVTTTAAEPAAQKLSLPEAVSLALKRNPDLAAAQQRVLAARAGLRKAEASFYPHLRVSETYTASDNPVQAFMMTLNQRKLALGPTTDFNDPSTTENFNTNLLATYSFFDGGRSRAARRAARNGREVAAYELETAHNDLVFEVTRSFYAIQQARGLVRTAEAAVTSMESNVELASARFEEGYALKTDVLDAEVRLAATRADFVQASNALALAEAIFRNVLGVGEAEPLTAAEGAGPAAATEGSGAWDAGTSLRDGKAQQDQHDEGNTEALDISRHPEFLAAQRALAVAENELRIAKGGHLPRLNGFAGYGLDSEELDRFSDSFVAGVSVELDVFDGFQTRADIAAARANLQAAREQLRRTELAIRLEVKQARLGLAEAWARLRTTRRAVEQAEESVQITKERYGNGLTLLAQVLDAEAALTAARQRRATAEADIRIAGAELNKALGKGWEE